MRLNHYRVTLRNSLVLVLIDVPWVKIRQRLIALRRAVREVSALRLEIETLKRENTGTAATLSNLHERSLRFDQRLAEFEHSIASARGQLLREGLNEIVAALD
jgi:cell division protein FtsB